MKTGNFNYEGYGTNLSNCRISIHLNLKLGQLSFSVSGIDQGIAFENIKKDEKIKYRLMVSMVHKQASVQIVDFHKQ